ncbi:MAG: carbohydrate-binding domain-containing protein [Clostridia bacterium]|nr:carbohydrate-binding domain-containing protein [Clostridia bacterium]
MKKFSEKITVVILTVVCICSAVSACGGIAQNASTDQPSIGGGAFGEESVAAASDKYSDFDLDAMWDSKATMITLADSGISISGSGASAEGSVLTVNREGTYVLSGTLSDGQIVVTVEKTEKVHLVLNGVNISCSDSSALYVTGADKVSVTVVKDTVNSLSDGRTYVYEAGAAEHNSCVYSKDDLTFNGTGTLNVTGNYNNGIATTNDLKIVSGTINVTAVNNAIKGKDSVAINSGNITVISQDDGIKVENELETEKGYLCIEGGTVNITAGDDALQSLQTVTVSGGMTTVNAGGQAVNCTGTVTIDENCFNDNSDAE